MKRILIAAAALALASTAHAQQGITAQRVGNQTFYRGAVNGWSVQVGNQTFYHLGNGASGHALRAGSQTFYNYSGNYGYVPAELPPTPRRSTIYRPSAPVTFGTTAPRPASRRGRRPDPFGFDFSFGF